ncbi:hypothetical protein ACWEKT_19830 [Nocardia takedensis]|uniref:hypothetical protein n=1 Tax=Nocardia takedensis TaxID=259390 RepID=UPI000319B981|nr:hypothetical protein [Nocardia takedensis]
MNSSRARRVGVAFATAVVVAALGACDSAANPSTSPAPALGAVDDPGLRFQDDREPVLAPGTECLAFTPPVRRAAALSPTDEATPVVPGHGCWVRAGTGETVGILTAGTPFSRFWQRDYPVIDPGGISALTVDKDSARLFERFILDGRYYAVRVASRWTAGLAGTTTKTACMVVVDTGSAQPLLVNLTRTASQHDPDGATLAQQCAATAEVARATLDTVAATGGNHPR